MIRNSLACLDLVSPNTFISIFNHLLSFCPDIRGDSSSSEVFPEAIITICFEVLKKFVTSKDLGTKLKVNAYETLSCFEGIRTCKVLAYFDFIEKLLKSPISKEYIRYSGKIFSIILARIEKEAGICKQQGIGCNEHASRCLKLIGELLNIKGLLDEEYDGIEIDLTKVFLFIGTNTVDFKSEILSIGCTMLKASKNHLKIMDPLVGCFGSVFESSHQELTDLYEIFYSYIRLDSQFILHEGQTLKNLSMNLVNGTHDKLTRPQMAEEGKPTPFKIINEILIAVLRNTCSDTSPPHISTVLKALLLINLEFQVWNHPGLNHMFKLILEQLFILLGKIETVFDSNRDTTPDHIVILYIWLILSLLNVYHYYNEEVATDIHSSGFIHGFINKGAEIIYSVYQGLPLFLQKIYQVALIRVLSSGRELHLDDDNATNMIIVVSNLLYMEITSTCQEDDSILGSHIKSKTQKKLKTTFRKGKESTSKSSNSKTASLVKEEGLKAEVSIVPDHDPMDFYITSVNMFTYFQRTFQDLKEANQGFIEALKSKLSHEEQSQLNEVLSVSVIEKTTSLVTLDPKTHIMKEKVNNGRGVRKIAKVARRDPNQYQ